MIINKFCRLADKTPLITFLYFIVEYIHLAISYKLLQLCKQLHSAKLFNNQPINLLHFILNTYHFYTFFTFIIHKIHSLRVDCVNFVKSCPKMSNLNSQKKKFSGLHPPFSELAQRLPPHPFNEKSTAIYQEVTAPYRPALYRNRPKSTQKSTFLTKCQRIGDFSFFLSTIRHFSFTKC